MARLTNRPSIIHSEGSHLPSPTPEPQTDQENIDPQQRLQKGKQHAVMSQHTPGSIHGAYPQQRANKRRRLTPEPQVAESTTADAKFTEFYDPNQDPEERREVTRQQRELNRELVESREELLADSGEKLTETVHRADDIFKRVKQTGDACVDSRALVDIGALAYRKSAALVTGDGSAGIDLDDFLSRCISYMRTGNANSSLANTQPGDDADEEEDLTPLDWNLLGRQVCFPHNSRPPVPTFLLGPLSLEKKQRAQTQRRAKQAKNTSAEARPEALDKDDLKESEQSSLTAQCTALLKHLRSHVKSARRTITQQGVTSEEVASTPQGKKILDEVRLRLTDDHRPGVPLFEYVINPKSFGQTIENLFHVSFLIKEGSAGIGLDDDELPVLFAENPRSVEEQRERNASKHQAVLSLDYGTWQDLIRAYNLQEPMIPHRSEAQPSQLGARGWYT